MTTIKALLSRTKKQLNNALDARLIVQHQLHLTHEDLLLHEDRIVSDKDSNAIEKMAERRKNNEPMAHIIGAKEFFGLDFKVTKETLIPRPDSETLIEAVLENYNKDFSGKILDLGTGSGCLIITLLKHLPNATGMAVDISKGALAIATENARTHNVLSRLEFINSSWNDLKDIKADIIISNPPYIETAEIEELEKDVKHYEPLGALDGGEEGLECYRDIFELSKNWLLPDGSIFIELGYNQTTTLEELATKKGLVVQQNYQDLNNIIRCMKLR